MLKLFAEKSMELKKGINMELIEPFKETASSAKNLSQEIIQTGLDYMTAGDLFSKFTADIIKEGVLFTR